MKSLLFISFMPFLLTFEVNSRTDPFKSPDFPKRERPSDTSFQLYLTFNFPEFNVTFRPGAKRPDAVY